jgi:hypothetical protein
MIPDTIWFVITVVSFLLYTFLLLMCILWCYGGFNLIEPLTGVPADVTEVDDDDRCERGVHSSP